MRMANEWNGRRFVLRIGRRKSDGRRVAAGASDSPYIQVAEAVRQRQGRPRRRLAGGNAAVSVFAKEVIPRPRHPRRNELHRRMDPSNCFRPTQVADTR